MMPERTSLYSIHEQLGARLIDFAGWEMPVSYAGIKEEHLCVRNKAGIFDVSHMGEFIIRGPEALNLIQKVTSNDASKLPEGKAHYSCLPNTTGGIIDDLIVYHIRGDEYMMVVNAANIQKDWDWIASHNTMNAELIDISSKTGLIAVAGPQATAIVQQLTTMPVAALPTYGCLKGVFNGIDKVLVATTGYTGERTYEIFFRQEDAPAMWNALMQAGKDYGLQPVGLGARDTLRLEMGYTLYGNDIDDSTSPLEAGLGWITKLNKSSFVGKEAILALKEKGISKKLVGFIVEGHGIPRNGHEIAVNGQSIGRVTSGSQSPILNKGIGMGYVSTEFAKEGQVIDILVRGKARKATIQKMPFILR